MSRRPTTCSVEQHQLGNPYYPAFDLLLAQLLAHEEVLKIVPRIIPSDSEGATETEALAIGPNPMSDQFDGFVADICEMRNDGYVRYFPTFRLSHAMREAQLHFNQVFQRRCYGWIVTQSFESFREFAEQIDRTICANQQEAACTPKDASMAIAPTSSHKQWPRLEEVHRRIGKAAPALRGCEERNARGVNLGSWLRTLAAVRHALVHSEGVIRPEEWQKVKSGGCKVRFPGSETSDASYVLDITPDAAHNTVVRLREYGLVIYKAVSEAAGCSVTLYDSDRGMTDWCR
jgi:hypothetical protein